MEVIMPEIPEMGGYFVHPFDFGNKYGWKDKAVPLLNQYSPGFYSPWRWYGGTFRALGRFYRWL